MVTRKVRGLSRTKPVTEATRPQPQTYVQRSDTSLRIKANHGAVQCTFSFGRGTIGDGAVTRQVVGLFVTHTVATGTDAYFVALDPHSRVSGGLHFDDIGYDPHLACVTLGVSTVGDVMEDRRTATLISCDYGKTWVWLQSDGRPGEVSKDLVTVFNLYSLNIGG